MVAAACSAQQRSESKKKEQQARVRALTQRWMGATQRSRGPRHGAMVLGSMPLIDGPRPQRMQLVRRRAALLKGRCGLSTGD
jgi:hypothetical protein